MWLVLLHAATAGAARTPRIVNGLATQDFPTAGALLYGLGGVPINADNAVISCSGTLIGCRTFLTAAHGVAGDVDPSHYWVYLQNAGTVTVSSVTYNPSYNPSLSGSDVAIIKFATDVTGIEPTQINSTHDLNAMGVGFSGTIAGFGLTSVTGRDYGIKRYGAVQTANCVTTVTGGEGNDKLVCWDFAIPVGPPGQDSDTCNGDSGGPLFMSFNGVTEVTGVTVAGSSPLCRPLDHSWDASVYYNAAWIQSQIGTDSTTTCGGIGPVGTSSATVIGNSGTLLASSPSASFTFNVSGTPSVLRVALNGQDYAFNPDLYVKAGPGAGPLNYDCKADGLGAFGSCEFSLPTPGIWSVFVSDASGAGQYQLTTTVFAPAGTPVAATPTATPTAAQAPTGTPTPSAAALTLSVVKLRPASFTTAANGVATLAGSFAVAAGSSFDASGGLTVRLQGTGFDQTHTWAPGECKTNGLIIRCASAHGTGSARFAPARLAGALTFTASLRALAVSEPFAGPVTVTLTQVGAGISRGGTIKTCHPQGKALLCK
jgi:secreted trypsin-like serine protease